MEAATTTAPVRPRAAHSGWRRTDRIFVGLCWAAGILLCLIAASLVLFMLIKGLQFLSVNLITTHPVSDLDQSKTGGFLDPLIGTVILAVLGTLIALPLIFGATRSALQAIPGHVREASYALGKTKAATIRRVLLPMSREGVATGTALGMGRIAGDTAIVVILLGATLRLQGVGDVPVLGTLRGTGSTLTSYVYNNSPAGEGNAPDKAYAAAFVLLMVVIALNFGIDLITSRRGRRA